MKGPVAPARQNAALVTTRGGMELSWRYAWVLFLASLARGYHVPLFPAACILAFSVVLNQTSPQKGLLVYQALLINMIGFIFAALLFVHHFRYSAYTFWNPEWMVRLVTDPSGMVEWFFLLLALFCLMMLWKGGWYLKISPGDYRTVCLQFDKGLGLLFSLLVVNAVFRVKAGMGLPAHALGLLIPAYLIFGLASVGLSRHQHDVEKSFLSGYRGLGVIFSMAVLTILFGAGLVSLFYPYLFPVADTLLEGLEQTTTPMVPYLVSFLRYILVPKYRMDTSAGFENGAGVQIGTAPPPADGWQTAVATIFVWATIGAVVLMLAVLLIYVLKRLSAWLLAEDTPNNPPLPFHAWLLGLLKGLLAIPLSLWRFLALLFKQVDSAARVYLDLLHWGRHCGLSKKRCETPDEYGRRLMRSFPKLSRDIWLIVETFDREVYGLIKTRPNRLTEIRKARRRMKRVRHWPRRVKVWLVS